MEEKEILELMGAILQPEEKEILELLQPEMIVVKNLPDNIEDLYIPTSREEQYRLALESIVRWVSSDQANSHVIYSIHKVATTALSWR